MVKRTELAEKDEKYPMLLRQPRLRRNSAFITYLINKQGVFRTIEAFIALFITFLFLTVFIPQQREQAIPQTPPNVLATLRGNDDFRNCVIQQNLTCVNSTIDKNLEDKYGFKVNISENPNAAIPGLPTTRVYANSMFVAGNTTNATKLVVRLYFWAKE
jgi:hypothetical protein